MARLLALPVALVALVLLAPGVARGAGGDYLFDGGTPRQRAQVRAALQASSFPWDAVPARPTIHIRRGIPTVSLPRHIWIDGDLLDAGQFAWGVVQHEYAHQVDFFLLDTPQRTILAGPLGAASWWDDGSGRAHHELGCERFAATLTWAYWPSPRNAFEPQSPMDESAAVPPAQFRRLLASLLGSAQLPRA